ncbi:MAG: hypothetical protein IT457_14770 [Planctomycetes bacterium]|nr:hypothetical protein [Planctomycetota bacterium]
MVKFFEGLPLFPSRCVLTLRGSALDYCAPAHAVLARCRHRDWRLGDLRVAKAAFNKMLCLTPGDNQRARFCLAAMEAGKS